MTARDPPLRSFFLIRKRIRHQSKIFLDTGCQASFHPCGILSGMWCSWWYRLWLVVLGASGQILLPSLLGLCLPVTGPSRKQDFLSCSGPGDPRLFLSCLYLFSFESCGIPSVRDFTDSLRAWFSAARLTTCCWLNSRNPHSAWNSLWRTSNRLSWSY